MQCAALSNDQSNAETLEVGNNKLFITEFE